ncbi:MAG TPA: diphthamide synthesis protein [Candidatus Nanoarchaeia archaeon]|nr:diphthamide synthesis protein [Candidatus Nanoarchaeia archaeon]
MKEWTIKDLKAEYSLDFEKIIELIIEKNAKRVLLQFPDGLKQYAKAIVDYLEEKTSAEFFIYLGTCFGACDTPLGMEDKVDLMIQLGHNSLMPNYLR